MRIVSSAAGGPARGTSTKAASSANIPPSFIDRSLPAGSCPRAVDDASSHGDVVQSAARGLANFDVVVVRQPRQAAHGLEGGNGPEGDGSILPDVRVGVREQP